MSRQETYVLSSTSIAMAITSCYRNTCTQKIFTFVFLIANVCRFMKLRPARVCTHTVCWQPCRGYYHAVNSPLQRGHSHESIRVAQATITQWRIDSPMQLIHIIAISYIVQVTTKCYYCNVKYNSNFTTHLLNLIKHNMKQSNVWEGCALRVLRLQNKFSERATYKRSSCMQSKLGFTP